MYCPPPELSLRIILKAAAPYDNRCTVFARVVGSQEIMNAIATAPSGTAISVKRIDAIDLRGKMPAAATGGSF
jgi:hypothetical protein